MAETIKLNGLDEVMRRMDALPGELTGKGRGGPLLATLRKMANKVRDDAKSRVSVDTGTLKENIIASRIPAKRLKGSTEGVEVTVRYKAKKYVDNARNRKAGRSGGEYKDYGPLFYARFLEFGTSRMGPKPFLTPAFTAATPEFPEMFRRELSVAIDMAVSKLASKR